MRESTRHKHDEPNTEGMRQDAEQLVDDMDNVKRENTSASNDSTHQRRQNGDDDFQHNREHSTQTAMINLANSFLKFSADLVTFGLDQMGTIARTMMGLNTSNTSHSSQDRSSNGYRRETRSHVH